MADKKTMKSAGIDRGMQDQFFLNLKSVIPPGIGMPEEIADILDVSIDSAYRRIRGETELTLSELAKLNKHYSISLDEIIGHTNDKVAFAYTKLTNSAKNFEEYLLRLTTHMESITKFENKKIYYVAEEIPLFYSFYTPKLSDFKLFYWQRSVLNCPEYQVSKYTPGIVPKNLVDIASECFRLYQNIPSMEVWTDLTVFTMLRQVGFYFDSGILNKETALELLAE